MSIDESKEDLSMVQSNQKNTEVNESIDSGIKGSVTGSSDEDEAEDQNRVLNLKESTASPTLHKRYNSTFINSDNNLIDSQSNLSKE